MQNENYKEYLETIILSLLAERDDSDITAKETTNPCYINSSFSVYNVRQAIQANRSETLALPKIEDLTDDYMRIIAEKKAGQYAYTNEYEYEKFTKAIIDGMVFVKKYISSFTI